jgi:short-subunit dehydrogenase
MNDETALITGSTSGIGLHLANEFAAHRHGLVLVAPVESELEAQAEEFRRAFAIPVRVIAKDLRKPEAAQDIFDTVASQSLNINILVNNAGFAYRGNFWKIPIEHDLDVLRLNIEAVVRLTKLLLPPMIEHRRGRVLNVASVAAFEPGPHLAIYHATKSFVLLLSEALAEELKRTGVTVTALCPGPTDTDFFTKSGMLTARMFQIANLMAPQDVARAGYRGAMRGDRVVVPGLANKAIVFSRRILPDAALAKLTGYLYRDLDPQLRHRERGDKERAADGPNENG